MAAKKMTSKKAAPAKKAMAPMGGLTAAQKKLPPALQKAIMAKNAGKKK
jgi:hypothetical protein